MMLNVDTSIVASDDFQAKIARRGVLVAQIKELSEEYNKLAFENILACNHPFIRVSNSNGRFPWRDSDTAVCKSCGLGLNGQSGFAPSVPFINFSNSLIVFVVNDIPLKDELEFKTSTEMQYALQYPKRFAPEYLHKLLEDSPFNSDDVLAADDRNYRVISNQIIDSHNTFCNDYYSD